MAIMLAAFSIMSLYAETILQIYVIVTSHAIPVTESPIAVTSLTLTLFACIVTSTTSAVLVLKSSDFVDKVKAKILFGGMHVMCIGLLWRIFKLILCFSDKELKQLTLIRLVHVVLQSAPYIILYTRFFIMGDRINIIQILSLLVSMISSALTVTSYNLHHKVSENSWEDKIPSSSLSRLYVAIGVTLTGTILVLSTRFASLSLMSVQKGWWLALPMAIHVVFMMLIFAISKRNSPFQSSLKRLPSIVFYCFGMSLLNTLELVYNNIDRVMCKYVAFYFLFLLENIVLLSVWLLDSDLPYVSKLIIVIGILTAFICGLIAKFAGCTLIQAMDGETNGVSTPCTIGTAPSVSTVTGSVMNTRRSSQIDTDADDLISIIQASFILKAQSHSKTASKTTSPNSSCHISSTISSPHNIGIHKLNTPLENEEGHDTFQTHTVRQITPRSKVSSHTSTERTLTSIILTESSTSCTCPEREYFQRTLNKFHTSQSSPDDSSDSETLTVKSADYYSSSHSQCFYQQEENAIVYSKDLYSEPSKRQDNKDVIELVMMKTDFENTGPKYRSPDDRITKNNENVRRKPRGVLRKEQKFRQTKFMSEEFQATVNRGCHQCAAEPQINEYVNKHSTVLNCTCLTTNDNSAISEESEPCAKLRSNQISYYTPTVTQHHGDFNFKSGKAHLKKKNAAPSAQKKHSESERIDITQVNPKIQTSQRNLQEASFQKQSSEWILSPDQLQTDQTESSFMSTTMTQYTTETDTTLTSSEMTSQTSWPERFWSLPDGTLRRKLRHPLPDDRSNITSSENIIKWLADTEQCQHEWTTHKPLDDT